MNQIARWILGLGLVTLAGVVFYQQRSDQSSRRIRAEALGMVEDMQLFEDDRSIVRDLVLAAHDHAFRQSLNLTRKHGRKFDPDRYVELVFDQVVLRLREDGNTRLADNVDRQRRLLSLEVRER